MVGFLWDSGMGALAELEFYRKLNTARVRLECLDLRLRLFGRCCDLLLGGDAHGHRQAYQNWYLGIHHSSYLVHAFALTVNVDAIKPTPSILPNKAKTSSGTGERSCDVDQPQRLAYTPASCQRKSTPILQPKPVAPKS